MKTCPGYPGMLRANSGFEGLSVEWNLKPPCQETLVQGVITEAVRWDGKLVSPMQYRTVNGQFFNPITPLEKDLRIHLNKVGRQHVMQYIACRMTSLPDDVIRAGVSWSWDESDSTPEGGMWLLEGQNWHLYLHPGIIMFFPELPKPVGNPSDWIDEVLCKAAEFAAQNPTKKR